MSSFRVRATRKFDEDPGYARLLDMFEATYEAMAPLEVVDGSRVYLVEALDSRGAIDEIGRLLAQAHLPNWPEHISGFHAEPL